MNKLIFEHKNERKRVLSALDKITKPIAQTLSPKGGNVIYETKNGDHYVTNDGVTIARNIHVSDIIENAIVEIVKHSALRTNTEAGDGTSTTILLSDILIREGLRLIDDGMNPMDVVKLYEKFGEEVKKKIDKKVHKIKDDKDLTFIAKISSNNDDKIAKDVVKVVKDAGANGQVIIDPSYSTDTEIISDMGFIIESGMFTQELSNARQGFFANYHNVPVLVTDKRLYYQAEAEKILTTCLENGYEEVVIVARDFIGEALPFFVHNHNKKKIKVLLVKDPSGKDAPATLLDDLAVYLGGEVVSDKSGSIVDNLQISDFALSKRVFSDLSKTVISRDSKEPNPELSMRISAIKKEQKKIKNKESKEYKELEKRLSYLTTGMVTVKVGGRTPIEIQERLFRYEDAINATRAAREDGYVVGGGLTLMRAVDSLPKYKNMRVFKKFGESNVTQIAKNCGLIPEMVLEDIRFSENPDFGYNALTETYENLHEAGVIDPARVLRMSIDNSLSIANVIISSNYLILNEEHAESEEQQS